MTYCPKRTGQTDNLPSARPYTASADPQRDRQPWASQRASSGQTRGPKPLGFLGKRRGSTHSPCTTPPPVPFWPQGTHGHARHTEEAQRTLSVSTQLEGCSGHM